MPLSKTRTLTTDDVLQGLKALRALLEEDMRGNRERLTGVPYAAR